MKWPSPFCPLFTININVKWNKYFTWTSASNTSSSHTRKMYAAAAAAIWWLEQKKKKKSTILARNSNKKIKLYYASGTWYANRRRKIKENFRWKPFCDGPHQTWEIFIFIFPHTICSNDAWFKPFCSTRAFMWISCILRRVCEVSCFCSTQRRNRRTSTHFMLNEKSKCGKLSMPSYVARMWPLNAAISATGSRVKMKRNRPRKNWLDDRKFCMAAHENFQYDDRRVCVVRRAEQTHATENWIFYGKYGSNFVNGQWKKF